MKKKKNIGLFGELQEQIKQSEEGRKRLSADFGLMRAEVAKQGTATQAALVTTQQEAAGAAQMAELAAQKTEAMAETTANIHEGVEGLKAEKAAAVELEELGREGATAVQIAVRAGVDMAKQVGRFAKHYPVWLADGGNEEKGSIKFYPKTGMAYICNTTMITRLEHWAPDIATNEYCPYPEPDAEGIYPYIYAMLVWPDMKVRDGNGDIYTCILSEGTYKLVYEPSVVPSVMTKEE